MDWLYSKSLAKKLLRKHEKFVFRKRPQGKV